MLMKNLKYKNINVHYSTHGEGSAVVLLHGFLENIEMWNEIYPHLAKNKQVICIDLLGHGKQEIWVISTVWKIRPKW